MLKRDFKIIDVIFIFWIALWIIPLAVLIPGYNYIWLLCQIVWLGVIIKNQDVLSTREKNFFYYYLFCYLLMGTECLVLYRMEILHSYVDLLQIPFIYFIFCYYNRKRFPKTSKKIIITSLILFSIVAVTTGAALIVNPYAARQVYVSGNDISQESLIANIGGYNFIYSITLLSVALFCYSTFYKGFKMSRLIYLGLFVFFEFVVLLSNFFTALVITVIGVGFFIIFRKKKRILPVCVLMLFLLPIYKEVANILIEGTSLIVQENGRTHERLQEIKFSLNSGTKVDDEVNTRGDVKKMSVDAFIDNPILGAITDSRITEQKNMIIGNHSTFLDTFAIFGIFMGMLIVSLFFVPFVLLLRTTKVFEQKMFVITMAVVFLLQMYNNNMTASAGYVVFFIFAYMNMVLRSQSNFKSYAK